MRALAADTTRALAEPLRDLAPTWTLGQRTGDTPAAELATEQLSARLDRILRQAGRAGGC